MVDSLKSRLVQRGPAEFLLGDLDGIAEPIRFMMTPELVASMDEKCVEQAVNTARAPGVKKVIINPDSHAGYGCPVGSVVVTDGFVYPGPVGPDICCSMSYVQTNIDGSMIVDRSLRRRLIEAITARIPTGAGNRQAPKGLGRLSDSLLRSIAIFGPSPDVVAQLGIPASWVSACESATGRRAHQAESLDARLDWLMGQEPGLADKLRQLGSYGGGNHFGEAQVTYVAPGREDIARQFGLLHGRVGFLNHCGSRGFGFRLAARHFKGLEERFRAWHIPFPGGDKELVYAPIDSPEGQNYLADMELGANFAAVNHLVICKHVCDAFEEVFGPQFDADLVYHISHNIGREELLWGDNRKGSSTAWVWRKGATRAFPGDHPDMKGTRFEGIGHPILLPGNPSAGSRIMVASKGAAKSAYSINHGAGRAMGRKEAGRRLNQDTVDAELDRADILSNCRRYPIDEAPAAYKDFNQVCEAVETADLATTVATLRARFVIKDGDTDKEGAA